jgi:hypothetical protein
MEEFSNKIQSLIAEVYSEWQKDENKGKGKWEVLEGFSEEHKIAVAFGNFNYQVENGGIEQWIYNGYFHDDSEKFIEYLEIGAQTDERCRTILDRVSQLDQYAKETDCDRYGNFYDINNDGDSSFIGDAINCNAFDSWYYENCGNEDWWEAVCGIIDKAVPQEHGAMDKDKFWQIIDDARESAGGWQDMYPPLVDSLSELNAPDIIKWKQILSEYQNISNKEKLWAAADIMLNGCSDDSFDYFRGWLTAQGKEVFMQALADPDSLAGVSSVQALAQEVRDSEFMTPSNGYKETVRFEEILYAASEAYKNKCGGDIYDALDNNPLSYSEKDAMSAEITFAADIDASWIGQPDSETRLQKLVPNIYRAFCDYELSANIHRVSVDAIKQMTGREGLVLQGCGGDSAEWLDGVNAMLTDVGILRNGAEFKEIYVFEHNDLTNILFPFDDMNPGTLDMGTLAMWRLQTHDTFGGTWLSDYMPNQLGIDLQLGDKRPAKQPEKPSVLEQLRESKKAAAQEHKPQKKTSEKAKLCEPEL